MREKKNNKNKNSNVLLVQQINEKKVSELKKYVCRKFLQLGRLDKTENNLKQKVI